MHWQYMYSMYINCDVTYTFKTVIVTYTIKTIADWAIAGQVPLSCLVIVPAPLGTSYTHLDCTDSSLVHRVICAVGVDDSQC